jgi:NADH dehydrogenase FAD-containing subunit
MHTIEADYLVVGAGATGMAFIDTLVSDTHARVVLVDRPRHSDTQMFPPLTVEPGTWGRCRWRY